MVSPLECVRPASQLVSVHLRLCFPAALHLPTKVKITFPSAVLTVYAPLRSVLPIGPQSAVVPSPFAQLVSGWNLDHWLVPADSKIEVFLLQESVGIKHNGRAFKKLTETWQSLWRARRKRLALLERCLDAFPESMSNSTSCN